MRFSRKSPFNVSLLCAALLCSTKVSALSLLQAYEAALRNDPTYRAAVSERAAGQQFQVLGRSHLLPSISASLSANKNQADVTSTNLFGDTKERRNYTSQAAAIQMRQPLYNPDGKARQSIGAAQAQLSEALFLARSQELIVRLVGLYAPAKYAEDQLAQAMAQRDAYAEQRKANERMLIKGEGTRTEVLEAQAKFDLSEAQILEARENLSNARNALTSMVGQEIASVDALAADFQVKPLDPADFSAWREMALAHNPEIKAQGLAVLIALEEVNKSLAGHAPRLDLIANLSKNKSDTANTFNQSTHSASIGIQLNLPLYSGGAVSATISQAMSNHDKAQAEMDAKTNQVLLELRKQYSLTLSGALRIAAAEKSLSSARLLVEATQKSVLGGIRTNLDVLNAQQQVFDAKRELALMRYNYLLSNLRLRYAAGTLERENLQSTAAYFVPAN